MRKRAYYGGYPVTRNSERLDPSVSDVDRTDEQRRALASHAGHTGGKKYEGSELNKLKAMRQARVNRKAKGKTHPSSLVSTDHLRREPTPWGKDMSRLDNYGVQGNNDALGVFFQTAKTATMAHRGSVELREAMQRKKKKKPNVGFGRRGEGEYLEGGELPSNENRSLHPHDYGSHRQTMVTQGATVSRGEGGRSG